MATAFVRIVGQDFGLKKALDNSFRALKRFSILTAGLGAVGAVFAVKIAADAEEMQSKFDAVFKNLSETTSDFAKDFAGRIGRSFIDTKQQLSEFQDVLVPLGFARKDAAGLSKALLQAATDLASFNNKTDAQASEALLKALTGEREMLKSLGIVINEADLKQELLARGQKNLTGLAMKQAKALATLKLVMQGSSDAQGDAERTAGSFTNRLKSLKGSLKDVAAAAGTGLLPALADLFKRTADSIRGMTPRIQEWSKNFSTVLDELGPKWKQFNEFLEDSFAFSANTVLGWIELMGADFNSFIDLAGLQLENMRQRIGETIGEQFIVEAGKFQTKQDKVGLQAQRNAGSLSERLKLELREIALIAGNPISSILTSRALLGDMTRAGGQTLDSAVGGRGLTSLEKSIELLKGVMKSQADERKRQLGSRKGGAPTFNASGLSGALSTGEGLNKPLSGFFGFADISKKLQEQQLKDNAQMKMLGLMDADKVAQKQQLSALETIAANTATTSNAPALKLAT